MNDFIEELQQDDSWIYLRECRSCSGKTTTAYCNACRWKKRLKDRRRYLRRKLADAPWPPPEQETYLLMKFMIDAGVLFKEKKPLHKDVIEERVLEYGLQLILDECVMRGVIEEVKRDGETFYRARR